MTPSFWVILLYQGTALQQGHKHMKVKTAWAVRDTERAKDFYVLMCITKQFPHWTHSISEAQSRISFQIIEHLGHRKVVCGNNFELGTVIQLRVKFHPIIEILSFIVKSVLFNQYKNINLSQSKKEMYYLLRRCLFQTESRNLDHITREREIVQGLQVNHTSS